MAGVNNSRVRQLHELALNTVHQLIMAGAGNIGAADTTAEEHIAAKEHANCRFQKGNMAGRVTRHKQYGEAQ